MSVVVTPAIACLNRGSNVKKRSASDDEEDVRSENSKKSKCNSWHFALANESSTSVDEDEESVYTMQGYETEYAQDTSDTHTCTSSCEGSASDHVEYELATESENEDPFLLYSSSSEPENFSDRVEFITFCNSEGLADDSDDSIWSVDSEVKKADFKKCVQCKNRNNNPMFRFCEKCYQLRKVHFPRNRPKRKPRTNQIESSISLTSSQTSSICGLNQMDSGISSGLTGLDSTPKSNENEQQQSEFCNFKTPNEKKESNLTKDKFRPDDSNTELQSADSDCSLLLSQDSGLAQCSQDSGLAQCSQDSGIGSSQDFMSNDSQSNESKNESLDQTKDKKDDSQTEKSCNNPPSTSSSSKQEHQENDWNSPCLFCETNPRNSGFPHGKIMHVCCCYTCAKKVWNSNGNRCPICKLKVNRIIKAFF